MYVCLFTLKGIRRRWDKIWANKWKCITDQLYYKISQWCNLFDKSLRNSWCFYRENIYNRKDTVQKNIFLKNGTKWLIYKFNIIKLHFEKFLKNGGTTDFHKFVYDEILYLHPTKLLLAFFNNKVSAIKEAILGLVQRKYPVALGNQTMPISTKKAGALNTSITPEL